MENTCKILAGKKPLKELGDPGVKGRMILGSRGGSC